MPISLVTASTAPTGPVTREEAKAWMRVDINDDDAVIDGLLVEATEAAQLYTARQFLTSTFDLYLDRLPALFLMPYGQLQSVTSITYLDSEGASQTLASGNYRVDTVSEPGRITPAYGVSWPSTYDVTNAVTVRFVCGYASPSLVPEKIKAAIKVYAAAKYLCRESAQDMAAFETLLSEYRLWTADL